MSGAVVGGNAPQISQQADVEDFVDSPIAGVAEQLIPGEGSRVIGGRGEGALAGLVSSLAEIHVAASPTGRGGHYGYGEENRSRAHVDEEAVFLLTPGGNIRNHPLHGAPPPVDLSINAMYKEQHRASG